MRLPTTLESTMIGCMNLARIRGWLPATLSRAVRSAVALVAVVVLLTACALPSLPQQLPGVPDLPSLPALPSDLAQLGDLLGELGIPDLSQFGDVPGLEALPSLATPAGAIVLQGPLEVGLNAGDSIAGTDITLMAPGTESARFRIAQFDATRRVADSLDFDGDWPGIDGVSYSVRLRIYRITDRQVRAAGVHRVVIQNVQPVQATVNLSGTVLRFPHSVSADVGQSFAGMTLGYVGRNDRGGELRGLPEGEYPYRKVGDSVVWEGRLRPDLAVEYQLRMLYYQEGNARLGGVALLALP